MYVRRDRRAGGSQHVIISRGAAPHLGARGARQAGGSLCLTVTNIEITNFFHICKLREKPTQKVTRKLGIFRCYALLVFDLGPRSNDVARDCDVTQVHVVLRTASAPIRTINWVGRYLSTTK